MIDACVHPLPDGGYRLWYKDEVDDSHTWAADSPDLEHWEGVGPVITYRPHEGPNIFALAGRYWMVVDEWRGQGVFHSEDLTAWTRQGLILDTPGSRQQDGTIGLHADVVVVDDQTAYIVYFTHPGVADAGTGIATVPTFDQRRSVIQAPRLRVVDGVLVCDRDEDVDLDLDLDGGAGHHIGIVTIPPGSRVTVRAVPPCTVVVTSSSVVLTTTRRAEAGKAATSARGSCAHQPVRAEPAAHRIAFSRRRAAVGPCQCPAR